jgi:hypothetical protein
MLNCFIIRGLAQDEGAADCHREGLSTVNERAGAEYFGLFMSGF